MNRRQLLRTTATIAASGLVLAACAGSSSPTPTATQLAQDVNLVAAGLTAALAQVSAIPGIATATVTQLAGYLATVQADAKIVAAGTAAAGTSVVQEIASGVQSIAAIVMPLVPSSSQITNLINAAISLLPVILAAVGLVAADKVVPVYTPAAARLILAGAAH